jgi:A/G-specific adenine glycosylase
MLQQTQVATVLERFYFPFLERFPTLKDVAEASEEAVLKAWEGLGYYSRARHLHVTAKRTGGRLPRSAEELEKLPGIGRSTARAIACFAYGEALPILDANVKRVLYRFFRRRKATQQELWAMAERLFDSRRPYDYNQAMMDLGAMCCTPKRPDCAACPLRSSCRGRQTPERYPEPKKRKKLPLRRRQILLCRRGDSVALVQRKEALLGGMWGFPQREEMLPGRRLGTMVYRYTHFELEATILESELPSELQGRVRFFTSDELLHIPLSMLERKIVTRFLMS